jgi:hypothetical protein
MEADHGLPIDLQDTIKKVLMDLNRPNSGRPFKLPDEVAIRIRKKLKERKQGWTTQQVHEMILKRRKCTLP